MDYNQTLTSREHLRNGADWAQLVSMPGPYPEPVSAGWRQACCHDYIPRSHVVRISHDGDPLARVSLVAFVVGLNIELVGLRRGHHKSVFLSFSLPIYLVLFYLIFQFPPVRN